MPLAGSNDDAAVVPQVHEGGRVYRDVEVALLPGQFRGVRGSSNRRKPTNGVANVSKLIPRELVNRATALRQGAEARRLLTRGATRERPCIEQRVARKRERGLRRVEVASSARFCRRREDRREPGFLFDLVGGSSEVVLGPECGGMQDVRPGEKLRAVGA